VGEVAPDAAAYVQGAAEVESADVPSERGLDAEKALPALVAEAA
jgi:hypothetical protein